MAELHNLPIPYHWSKPMPSPVPKPNLTSNRILNVSTKISRPLSAPNPHPSMQPLDETIYITNTSPTPSHKNLSTATPRMIQSGPMPPPIGPSLSWIPRAPTPILSRPQQIFQSALPLEPAILATTPQSLPTSSIRAPYRTKPSAALTSSVLAQVTAWYFYSKLKQVGKK